MLEMYELHIAHFWNHHHHHGTSRSGRNKGRGRNILHQKYINEWSEKKEKTEKLFQEDKKGIESRKGSIENEKKKLEEEIYEEGKDVVLTEEQLETLEDIDEQFIQGGDTKDPNSIIFEI